MKTSVSLAEVGLDAEEKSKGTKHLLSQDISRTAIKCIKMFLHAFFWVGPWVHRYCDVTWIQLNTNSTLFTNLRSHLLWYHMVNQLYV